MKPFRFRLERLKKVRSSQERAARASFASTLGDLAIAERTLRESLERRDGAREELRHILGAGHTASAFLTAQRVTDRFEDLVHKARLEHRTAAAAVNKARAAWATIRSKDEGLGRLRAARKFQHRLETERWLARELDEVAMNRSARRGNPVGNTPTETGPSS